MERSRIPIETLITPEPISFFITQAAYFALVGLIGYFAAKSTKNLKEFLVMGRKAGPLVVGFSYFASQYSMSTFVGVPAATYVNGFSGMSISTPGLAFTIIIPALFVGRKLMRLGCKHNFLTMTDYLSDRYESKNIRALHIGIIISFLIIMMGVQSAAAGLIFHTFTGLPAWIGVIFMGSVVTLYCMAGGVRGAMMTDVLQGFLMVGTAIIAFVLSIRAGGGLESISQALFETDPSLLSHPGPKNRYGWQMYMSMVVIWSFFAIGQPHLFTKFLTMRSYRVLFLAVIFGTLGCLISGLFAGWMGVNAIASIPELDGKTKDFVVPLLLQQNLGPFAASLLVAGIISAGISTIDSLLVVAAGGISYDIYKGILNPNASEKSVFWLSRISTVALGIIATVFGIYKPGSVFKLVQFAFGGTCIWMAPILLGMYWKKANKQGAMISVIIGEAFYLLMKLNMLDISFGFDPLIISWCITMVIMITVSLLTPPPSQAAISRHFDKMKQTSL